VTASHARTGAPPAITKGHTVARERDLTQVEHDESRGVLTAVPARAIDELRQHGSEDQHPFGVADADQEPFADCPHDAPWGDGGRVQRSACKIEVAASLVVIWS
jgi:hypothetical protein